MIVYKWITTQDSAKYMVVFNMFEIRNYVKHAKRKCGFDSNIMLP